MTTSVEEIDPLWVPDSVKCAVWDPASSIPVFDEECDAELLRDEILTTIEVASELVAQYGLPAGVTNIDDIVVDGMEIGDDRADCSNNPKALALMLVAQERWFGMATSKKDTAISVDTWNLCEVTSIVPRTPYGSVSRAKVDGFDNLEYVDAPPLRIIIDVQKGDRSHSSSAVGKASMLGSRVRSARGTCRPVLEIAGWLQDSNLRTCNSPDPKYLPWNMGGSSCPPLWGQARNLYLYVQSYKGGTYGRIYGSATNELRACVQDLDLGQVTQPVLSSRLRMRDTYLHATYASNVVVPRSEPVLRGKEPVEPIYKALGGTSLLQGVENRLVQAKRLCTPQMAQTMIEQGKRLVDGLFGGINLPLRAEIEKLELQRERSRFGGAIRANAAIRRLLDRNAADQDLLSLAGHPDFLVSGSGVTGFTYYDARWLADGGKGQAFTMSDLIRSEDMYLVEEVETGVNMRVGGIPLNPGFTYKSQTEVFTKEEKGLWQVSLSMEEWADEICSGLKAIRESYGSPGYAQIQPLYYKHREWVADDSLLVDRATALSQHRTAGTIVLVSTDYRLARVMAQTSGLPVAVCPPLEVLKSGLYEGKWSAQMSLTPGQALGTPLEDPKKIHDVPPVIDEVLIDTGSAAAHMQHVEGAGSGRFFLSTLTSTGTDSDGRRYDVVRHRMVSSRTTGTVLVFFPNGSSSRHRIAYSGPAPSGGHGPVHVARNLLCRFRRR